MITDIQDQTTCDIFAGDNTKAARKIPKELHKKAKQLLEILNASKTVQDMASPPENRLHKLEGDLAEFWSVSINGQYRIIFKFDGSDVSEVLITDYH